MVFLAEPELDSIWPTPATLALLSKRQPRPPGCSLFPYTHVWAPSGSAGLQLPALRAHAPRVSAATPPCLDPKALLHAAGGMSPPPLPEVRLAPGVPPNKGVPTTRGPEHAVPSLQPQQDPKLGPDKGMHLTDLEGCPQGGESTSCRQSRDPQADVGPRVSRLLPPAHSAWKGQTKVLPSSSSAASGHLHTQFLKCSIQTTNMETNEKAHHVGCRNQTPPQGQRPEAHRKT